MRLAIDTHNGTVCVDHGNGIIGVIFITLKEADRNDDPQTFGYI